MPKAGISLERQLRKAVKRATINRKKGCICHYEEKSRKACVVHGHA